VTDITAGNATTRPNQETDACGPLGNYGRAKLAAALSDDDVDELGMTIAYLKRSLKAITVAMDGGAQLLAEKLVNPQQYAVLQKRLFQVRDGIILLMGEYRGEWLRRYGNL
jgi:hypothetical protein